MLPSANAYITAQSKVISANLSNVREISVKELQNSSCKYVIRETKLKTPVINGKKTIVHFTDLAFNNSIR